MILSIKKNICCLLINSLSTHYNMQKLPSAIKIHAPSSGKLSLETEHKNGYGDMEADYHIDSENCIDITTGWKDFVS